MAYVYLNYGIHYLVNAVTEPEGQPAAVLIRALVPIDNPRLMRERRAPDGRHLDTDNLCRGPGRLTRALGITLAENGLSLAARPLYIEDRGLEPGPVAWSPRIGIRVAADRLWRCAVVGNRAVSHRTRRA
jgi:DNA-3-methyladenine glycosylase